jgi:selenocysteine lyase/cysteine desulfurase
VRRAAARYLGVAPEELALTDRTTAGLGLTYHCLRLQPGDHLLTTAHDFYSTHEALRLAAARTGARVTRVALYDDPARASAAVMVSRLRAAVRPETRVVAVTWVHSSTGVRIPAREISAALAQINAKRPPAQRALLCLDAVHGFGVEDAGPADVGCDVFISGTHKWLFGPRGTGLVWARPEAGQTIAPIIPPFSAPSFVNWLTGEDAASPFGQGATPGGYKAFEHRWAAADAFEFHLAIGRQRVAARTRELATRLKDGLAGLANVRLVTPRDPALSAGIVCCEVAGRQPASALEVLRREHGILASVTPYREQHLRFGPSIVNTPDEVDAAVQAVAGLR